MILYFSATGNCKYVAQRIKEDKEQEIVFIPEAVQQSRYDFEDETIRKLIGLIQQWQEKMNSLESENMG